MVNLLPFAASRAPLPTAGVYIGESLPPVPTKLASKILRWEYVEMAEMLPEFWSGAKLEEEDTKHGNNIQLYRTKLKENRLMEVESLAM